MVKRKASGPEPSAKQAKVEVDPIFDIIEANQLECVRNILVGNIHAENDNTQLHRAVMARCVPAIVLIVSCGADINAQNSCEDESEGDTALTMAAVKGFLEEAKTLLDHGANLEAGDKFGNTPLNCASWYGHVSMVELLLDRGVNLEVANNSGFTPLIIASHNGHVPVVELLLNRGANIEAVDNDCNTVLHSAAGEGQVSVIKLLLAHNANIEAVNNKGKTPLQIAASKGHCQVVKVLLEARGRDDLIQHGHDLVEQFTKYKNLDLMEVVVQIIKHAYFMRDHGELRYALTVARAKGWESSDELMDQVQRLPQGVFRRLVGFL